jgi:pimeloyl-ACP methyl ester carboxylesterase
VGLNFRIGLLRASTTFSTVLVLCLLFVVGQAQASSSGSGITIEELRLFANSISKVEFKRLRENPSVNGESRELVSFRVDGLLQYALILTPPGDKPTAGWPALLFNHGFHPNPPDYGRIAGGTNNRPGDYYRGIAQAFVDRDYLVVVPDYRGHNDSEGAEFTKRALADSWYTRDAITAWFGMASLDKVNTDKMYMLGHSMGGPITLRAALALGDRVQAASVWSGSGERPLPRMMSDVLNEVTGRESSDTSKPGLDKLAQELAELGGGVSYEALTARASISDLQVPLMIQHSRGDRSTDVNGSLELAAALYLSTRKFQLHIHESDKHLFDGKDFDQAVENDSRWFESY